MAGVDPLEAYAFLIKGSLTRRVRRDTLVKTISSLQVLQWLSHLSVIMEYRRRRSTLYGAFGRASVGIAVVGMIPSGRLLSFSLRVLHLEQCSVLCQRILKVKLGVSEIIVTVLLNFVALLFISYLLHGPIKAPGFLPYSPDIFPESEPANFGRTYQIASRLIIAALVAIFVHFLWKSKIGFELKSVGMNISAARYAGMNITKSILITMAISGGLA